MAEKFARQPERLARSGASGGMVEIGGDLRLLRVTQIDPERVCLHYRLLHFTGSKA